jgi:hypothetical protein
MPRAQTTTDDGCMRDFSPLPKHPRPRRAELRRRQDLPPVRTAASLASVVRCARHRHRPTATRELFSGPRRTVRNSLRETSGTGWANWVSRSRPVRRRCFPEDGRTGIAWAARELRPPLLDEAPLYSTTARRCERWPPSCGSARARQDGFGSARWRKAVPFWQGYQSYRGNQRSSGRGWVELRRERWNQPVVSTTGSTSWYHPKRRHNVCSNTGNPSSTRQQNVGRKKKKSGRQPYRVGPR